MQLQLHLGSVTARRYNVKVMDILGIVVTVKPKITKVCWIHE